MYAAESDYFIETHGPSSDVKNSSPQGMSNEGNRFLPVGMTPSTSLGKAMLEHPADVWQTAWQIAGSIHATSSKVIRVTTKLLQYYFPISYRIAECVALDFCLTMYHGVYR